MSSGSVVVIEEVDVPVFESEPVLLDDDSYVREVTMLMADVYQGDNLSRSAEASLRAFRQYKILSSPTKPYPHYGSIENPVFVYEYDKVIVLDKASEKLEIDKITRGDGGFDARTLVSELRALKQFRGAIRRRVWRPVSSDKGETVFDTRDPVERHCETEKCAGLFLADGRWGGRPVDWIGEARETARLLPGDPAYFRGLKGMDPRRADEDEIAYFRRVRPAAADVVKRDKITDPASADAFGLTPALRGFVYDSVYSESLRSEAARLASSIKKLDESATPPGGLAVVEPRSSHHERVYFEQKPASKLDCEKKLKAARSKLESAERKEGRQKTAPGYVRTFDSFASMQKAIVNGIRDREHDPTPRELIEGATTVAEVMKASPVKISREVAEDVLRGGKVMQEGDRVLLVDRSGRRDVFEKSRDPQGDLFWALKGSVAVAGVRACQNEDDKTVLAWDLCDMEIERVNAKANFFRETVAFLEGCADRPPPALRDDIVFFRADGKYRQIATEGAKKRNYTYVVAGTNIVAGLDEVILHPEYREGFTQVPRSTRPVSDGGEFETSDPESSKDLVRMVVSRSVDGMSAGASLDAIGVNTRVLRNMVMFAVSSVADVFAGGDQERRARLLRLITTALIYTVVYITIARQIADPQRRDAASRTRLLEIAVARAKAVDFSEFFPDRSPLRAAMDKKLVVASVESVLQDELSSSPLLRDMISRDPDTVFALTAGGRSIKNWVGFRPALSETGSPAYNEIRRAVREAMLPTNKSVAGFTKRGRCCPLEAPKFAREKEVEGKRGETKALEDKLRAITKTKFEIRDDFVRDVKNAVAASLRRFARTLAILAGPKAASVPERVSAKQSDIAADLKASKGISGPDPVANLEKTFESVKATRDLLVKFVAADVEIAASDDGVVTLKMEKAREELKKLQVAYVETLDPDSKQDYLAQREIGIKLDEVREYDLVNSKDLQIQQGKADIEDNDHEFGDYALETVEDDGSS